MPLIEASRLRRVFYRSATGGGWKRALRHLVRAAREEVVAVDDVSFQIAPGEVVGFLGLNGSGKSTTIKMLLGVLVPTSGTVVVDGLVPAKHRTQLASRAGVVFGHRTGLWWDLPVCESFAMARHLYRISPRDYREMLDQLESVVDLGRYWHTPVRQLSLGERMRVELASVFLHRPKLLVLDEPTIGLDFVAKNRVREFITTMNRDYGTTVLLTTHDLADVEFLCRRVIVIERGKILFDDAIAALVARHGGEFELEVRFSDPSHVRPVQGGELVSSTGAQAVYRLARSDGRLAGFVQELAAAGGLLDLNVRQLGLEQLLARLYGARP